jgi:hypothetical protein
MLRKAAVVFGILLVSGGARAEHYLDLTCSDMAQHVNWSEHVVGWLNLENIESHGQTLDFAKAGDDAAALRSTCAQFPRLTLLQAVAMTFPELDGIGAGLADRQTARNAGAM